MSKRIFCFLFYVSMVGSVLGIEQKNSQFYDTYLVAINWPSGKYKINLQNGKIEPIIFHTNKFKETGLGPDLLKFTYNNEFVWVQSGIKNTQDNEKQIIYFDIDGNYLREYNTKLVINQISRNGNYGIVWDKEKISIVNLEKNQVAASLKIQTGYFDEKIFFHSKMDLLLKDSNNYVYTYNSTKNQVEKFFKIENHESLGAISPNNQYFLVVGNTNKLSYIKIVDVLLKKTIRKIDIPKSFLGYLISLR